MAPEPVRSDPELLGFPSDFVWGVATAAFQIEGDRAGRGDSIWDALCDRPGAVVDGSNADIACDHVHRYPEDVALMRGLGVDAYRFSISWPRVQPGGRGPLAASGVGFYDRLVDTLLEAGIQPWATLYHWDLPVELQADGGWAHRGIVDAFTEYAVGIQDALGDRVRNWMTINEPWCVVWLGHGNGYHAPGVTDRAAATRASHHVLLAHGRAVRAMRAQARPDSGFGMVLNSFPFYPARWLSREQAEVVRPHTRMMDGVQNRWWLDALFTGRYPEDVLELLGPDLEGVVRPGDLDEIAQPLDFLGINYYNDQIMVPSQRTGEVPEGGAFPAPLPVQADDPGEDGTTMGWAVTPQGLRDHLVRLRDSYPGLPPILITENGSAYVDDPDDVGPDGFIEDPMRVAYLRSHLSALARAVRDGVDVRGYFVWSLLDNFEWAWGYTQRFGLVRVDYQTQVRTPKRSYQVYRDLVAAQRTRRQVDTPV
jgi:beta-glucosidase